MKTIILPTDFSPIATNALHYSIEMAKATNATLLLFHVYQVPVTFTDVPLAVVSIEELENLAAEKLKTLQQEANHIASGAITIATEIRLGNVVDELEALCADIKPFAVIMGSKGSSGLEQMIYGSNTLTAIKHLTSPVICVPPGKLFGSGISKIGLACEFKDVLATTPIQIITDFVNAFKAELHVLNVDFKDRNFNPDTTTELEALYAMLTDMKPLYHFIEHWDIEDGINEFAETNNLDLVITIPKKHKLLEGLFKPSSTKQLIYQSHLPVMCIHA